jgi:uncharacterized protein YjbJ (UPF0337 family)
MFPEQQFLVVEGQAMDWKRIEGNWKQTAGKIKEK